MSLPMHHPGAKTPAKSAPLAEIEAGCRPTRAPEGDLKGKATRRAYLSREKVVRVVGLLHLLVALTWLVLADACFKQVADFRRAHAEEVALAHAEEVALMNAMGVPDPYRPLFEGGYDRSKGGYDGFYLAEAEEYRTVGVIIGVLAALNLALVPGLLRFHLWARWTAGVQALIYAIVFFGLPVCASLGSGEIPRSLIWIQLLSLVFGPLAFLLLSPWSSPVFSKELRASMGGKILRDRDGLL